MKSDTSQLTLLGHKTVYKQDYAPEVLETFINTRKTITGCDSTARSLPVCARLPDNPTLLPYKSTTFPENTW